MADESNRQNVVELARLFVGGLPNGISQKDLRMKFTPFGNVKDLEIITRRDDTGTPLKTFAYIDIDISAKNVQKCLSTYNNCSWKGGSMKVQIAKEHYLSRLEKEKTKTKKDSKKKSIASISHVSSPDDMKSAVPGTLVPDRRNWVIGKFGRALPVVFLRRRDGRKVAKFDPSKTVHCLKKIRDENKQKSESVEDLTWNIDRGSVHDNENYTPVYKKNHNAKKRSSTEVNDNASGTSKKKRDVKCKSVTPNILSDDENGDVKDIVCTLELPDGEVDICVVPGSDESDSKEDDLTPSNQAVTERTSPKDILLNSRDATLHHNLDNVGIVSSSSSSDEEISTKDGVVTESDESDSNEEDMSPSNQPVTKRILPNQNLLNSGKTKVHHDSDSSDVPSDSSSDEETNTHNCVVTKSDELDSNVDDMLHTYHPLNENVLSEENLKDNGDAMVLRDSGSSAVSSGSSSDEQSSPEVNGNLPNNKSRCEAVGSTVIVSKTKGSNKELSNKLRLESLKQKTEVMQKQKDVVKNALRKVDSNRCSASRHLKLDEEQNGEEVENNIGGKKITGQKALSWLGFDNSSDEEDTKIFGGKEHLHGKTGEKLMELQQKIGHDQRFQMDERFVEIHEESIPTSEQEKSISLDNCDSDEFEQQLKAEKEMSFSVLQQLLGNDAFFTTENEDSRNQYRDSLAIRYDPTRENHEDFEEISKTPAIPEDKDMSITNKASETEQPVVAKSQFYNVTGSLKQLFEKKDDNTPTFSFFSDLLEEESVEKDPIPVALTDEKTNWKAPLEVAQPLPYDSSASESENELNDLPTATSVHQSKHLFYHSDNHEMMKTLKAESSSFVRKDTIETINQYWVDVRQRLTQDYKKKRKDALRRQRKQSHRR